MTDKNIEFWEAIKKSIKKISQIYDKTWQKRKRLLDTKFLISFIFKLVLSKNKQGYGSILANLWEEYAEKGIVLPQNKIVAASSVCEARQKLPETVFQELNQNIVNHFEKIEDHKNWNGHRVFAVDGSRVTLPKELLEQGYKIYNEKKGYYPVGLVSCLYNLQTGIAYDFELVNHNNERICAANHLNIAGEEDIIVYDRGYFSYLLLYQHSTKNIHCVFRIQNGRVNQEIAAFWNSDDVDKVIEYYPAEATKSDLRKRGFNLKFKPIQIRLIKHTISKTTYIYATTLVDKKYKKESFSQLYHARWGIEELYKISKRLIEVEDFHSKTEVGVKQEIYAHFVLINISRFFEIAATNHLDDQDKFLNTDEYHKKIFVDTKNKLNFKNCLFVVSRYLEEIILLSVYKFVNKILPKIIRSIVHVRYKIRPNRHYKRISHTPISKWHNGNLSSAKA